MKHDFLRRLGALMLSVVLVLTLIPGTAWAEEGEGGGGDGTTDTGTGDGTTVEVTAITLNESTLTLKEGENGTLTATVEPDNATDKSVSWTSSDTDVATVNNGEVTAVKEGTATITATAGNESANCSATCEVTVTAAGGGNTGGEGGGETTPTITSISINQSTLTIAEQATATLSVVASPAGVAAPEVTWTSSTPSVATVSSTGVVTGEKKGTTVITATSKTDPTLTATCSVTVTERVVPATGISLNTASYQFNYNNNRTAVLVATIEPGDANSNTAITWASGDSSVVTVAPNNSSGTTATITAVSPGSTKVTARVQTETGEAVAECTVVVSGIVLDKHEISVMIGRSETLSIGDRSYGDAAGTGSIVWTTRNSTVATVTNGGQVTGRSVGTVTITATRGNYTDECTVTVTENTAAIVNVGSVTAGSPISLSGIRTELNSRSLEMTGYNLSYITNVNILPAQGILYYNYTSSEDTGSGVASATGKYYYSPTFSQQGITGLTFVPNTAFSGNADIAYTAWSTNNESFTGVIRVTVNTLEDVSYSTIGGNAIQFQASDFNAVCRNRTGRDLNYVTFTLPAASAGTLYYNYTGQTQYAEKVTAGTAYYRSRTPYLESVTFLPTEDYVGTLRIAYRAVDTAGSAFDGQITIKIDDRDTNTGGTIHYNASQGQRVTFLVNDFTNACQQMLNQTLSYVIFTLPSSSDGTLYYSYNANASSNSRVTAGTRYYRVGSPNLSYITFVPASTSLGKVNIEYTAYSNNGERFTGTVIVNYSGEESDIITYTAYSGRALQFESADFNEMSQRLTGRTLNYVRFNNLPSSTQGVLYASYYSTGATGSRVTTTGNYYRTSLSNVTFVPNSSYTGTVSIGFTGYDTSGYTFSGVVYITVEKGTGTTTVSYRVRSGESISFSANDFNTASLNATGANLNYIRFGSLPSASYGELYYRYNQTASNKVTTTTNYYRTSGNTLDQVSFVAAATTTGTIEIPYSGWSTTGQLFSGTIQIELYMPTAETLQYSGSSSPIALQASAFRRVCNAVMSRELSYIQFTSLPSSSAGRLYYNYSNVNATGTQVTTGTSYYYGGSPSIDQLSFVPVPGYQGTVTLRYAATDAGGEQITGTILITLSGTVTSSFTDMSGHLWAVPAVEYLYQNGVVNGIGNNQFAPANTTLRCEFAVMICRAFDFKTSVTSSFPDVPANSYYAQSVAAAKAYGIVTGVNGMFLPNNTLSRQEAMVMLYRALVADGWSLNGLSADLSGFVDNGQIASYAREAVAALVQLGIVNGSGSYIYPTATVSRAEMAAMLYRAMTL